MYQIVFEPIKGQTYLLNGEPCTCKVRINGVCANGTLHYFKNRVGQFPTFTFEVEEAEHEWHDTKFDGTFDPVRNSGIAQIRTEV